MMKKMKTTTQTHSVTTFTNKIAVLLLIFSIIFSLAGTTALAQEEGHLVTLLIVPDESITYTNYDSAYLKVMNTGTGEIHNYTLYPYNNFSNKVLFETGEYAVIDVGIKGRNDLIFEADNKRIFIDSAQAIIVNLKDSRIIKTTTTTTTTTSGPISVPSTFHSNPILPSGPTNPEQSSTSPSLTVPTITFPPYSDPSSYPNTDSSLEHTTLITKNPYENPYLTTSPDENPDQNPNKNNNKMTIVILVVLFILALIFIIFFFVMYKKNKE